MERHALPTCMAATSTSTQSRARSLPVRPTGPSVRSMRLRQRVRRAAPQRLRAFARGDEAELAMPSVDELMLLLQSKRLGQGLPEDSQEGEVHLVGTGPGDPGLLTLRALRLMQSADVVLYDRLVSDDILRLISHDALLVYVGKRSGYHHRTQDEINELILQFARRGSRVLRLKGGDPNMFGRGGEEMEYLRALGVAVHIVPGITAAAGIGAELQIPLTTRGVANSTVFLTGHSRIGGEDPLDEIAARADERTTLVIYMGLAALPQLAQRLRDEGLPHDLPAVAVMKGTTANQVAVFADMADLPAAVQREGLKSPTLVIMGHVVAMSNLYPGAGGQATFRAGAGRSLPLTEGELLDAMRTAEAQLLSLQVQPMKPTGTAVE